MNKLGYKILTVLTVVFFTSSCEDILEKTPVSSLTFESFWNSENDFDAGLVACYDLTQGALSNFSNSFFLWGEGRADGVTNRTGVGLAFNDVSPGDLYGVNWYYLYRLVNQTNLLIRYTNNTDLLNSTKKNQILGEAHFLRALGYFYLVRIWKNVPLLIEGYDSSSQELYPRNDAPNQSSMVWDQIKDDINKAVNYLEFSDKRHLAARASALALRADVNLWMGYENSDNTAFESVVADIDQIINNGIVEYKLIDNFRSIFGTNISSEDVFVLKFGTLVEPNEALGETWPGSKIEVSPEDKAKGIYIPWGFNTNGGGYNRYNVSEKLVNLFDDLDQRKDATFAQQFFPDKQPGHGLPVYWCTKYLGGTTFDDPVIKGRIDHIRLYRTAGILLMKAEALAKLNKINQAVDIVNSIRERAYGSSYNVDTHGVKGVTSANEMLDVVLNERFKELAWEGKRWFDLVRTKKALTERRDRLSINEEERPVAEEEGELLWPISVTSLTQNPNLVQNEFYR